MEIPVRRLTEKGRGEVRERFGFLLDDERVERRRYVRR